MMDATTYEAGMPRLARIVELLGGFGRLPMGDDYVINLEREQIVMPGDDYDPDVVFPPDDDHLKALHIRMMSDEVTDWVVEGALWALSSEGDPYAERAFTSIVPKQGWEAGRWHHGGPGRRVGRARPRAPSR